VPKRSAAKILIFAVAMAVSAGNCSADAKDCVQSCWTSEETHLFRIALEKMGFDNSNERGQWKKVSRFSSLPCALRDLQARDPSAQLTCDELPGALGATKAGSIANCHRWWADQRNCNTCTRYCCIKFFRRRSRWDSLGPNAYQM
jgi:hypothetical protein